ncbi:hypothetical protein JZ751_008068 [Albula glossodonta]|uniref:T-box domain-containing protein n=1 Tax=Albula glossodonta TaxID=121402 RepID=A0A8T2NYT1_9TELE|nr:hypothetical protein JZ751_008068 [Albula glossodonta]
MFPFLSFNISALDPSAHYSVYVDVVLADQHHWRYQGGKWVQCGKAEGNMPVLMWTCGKGCGEEQYNSDHMIVLQSLHKYQPRLHIVEVKEDGSEDPFLSSKAQTFTFPETQFIAVTAYQNADITQLKIDHNPFAKGFRDNYDTLYAPPEPDRLTPSPTDSQQLVPGSCYPQTYLADQYVSALPQSRFFSQERMGMGQQAKDPSASPHSRWYLSSQQGPPSGRLEFNSYDGDLSSNGFYKPFPLQTSAHHPLGYYQDHHFPSGSVSAVATTGAGPWGTSRPSPQYLNHPHPSKTRPSLSWFRPVPPSSSSSSESRLHPSSLLEPLAPPPPPQDKPKEAGDETWLEPPSVKSVDSADSGLYEGAESKRRRVSPYASSTESSPPNRGAEACEKDSGSDAGYYGFYTN